MVTLDPKVAPEPVQAWIKSVQAEIDEYLDRLLAQPADDPGRLRAAMRYAALSPGKRLRPALCLAACAAVSGDHGAAVPAAAAIELVHAYTLVHDDLPCMDDDVERRGQPTVHVAFGEAIALLVGNALLTKGFGLLAELGPGAAKAIAVLAQRAGADELLLGQALDLALSERSGAIDFAQLEVLHASKTGALFAAATEIGGIAGGASPAQQDALARFGLAIGIAFQHADDRDDNDFCEHAEAARARMKALTDEAAAIARGFGDSGHTLLAIASWIGARA